MAGSQLKLLRNLPFGSHNKRLYGSVPSVLRPNFAIAKLRKPAELYAIFEVEIMKKKNPSLKEVYITALQNEKPRTYSAGLPCFSLNQRELKLFRSNLVHSRTTNWTFCF